MSFTVRSGAGRKKVIIVSGPSGVGKTTLVNAILADRAFAGRIRRAVSHTTRQPREGEVSGVHYHFVSTGVFRELVDAGKMIESAAYAGNYYGVSWAELDAAYRERKALLMTIEVAGHRAVRKHVEVYPEFDVFSVFIEPDSMECIARRVQERGGTDSAAIDERMQQARVEIDFRNDYDAIMINPDGKSEVGVERLARLIGGQLALWQRG